MAGLSASCGLGTACFSTCEHSGTPLRHTIARFEIWREIGGAPQKRNNTVRWIRVSDLLEAKGRKQTMGGPCAVWEPVTTYLMILTSGDSVGAEDIGPNLSNPQAHFTSGCPAYRLLICQKSILTQRKSSNYIKYGRSVVFSGFCLITRYRLGYRRTHSGVVSHPDVTKSRRQPFPGVLKGAGNNWKMMLLR